VRVIATANLDEECLELKYCERCGGLWLRPAGGEQIYCVICARAMAELPPSSTEVKSRTATHGKKARLRGDAESCKVAETDLDVLGGVA
jgi:hypothetical protein